MVDCLECGNGFIPEKRLRHNETPICPKCLKAFEIRGEIIKAIETLNKYAKLGEEQSHSSEFHRINGFSWSQKESFSIALTRFYKSFELLEKPGDFCYEEEQEEYKKQTARSGW